jgi:hypothetical protein
MVTLFVIVLAFGIALAGRRCWTHAEEFCRQGREYSERVRQPWRSLFYPRWFWHTGECEFHMRSTGIAAFVMAALLLIIAAIRLLSGHS